jgi:hypothetical protein
MEAPQGIRRDVVIERLARIQRLVPPSSAASPSAEPEFSESAHDEVDAETAAALDRISFVLGIGQQTEPWRNELDD